jgi:hypothetical protein
MILVRSLAKYSLLLPPGSLTPETVVEHPTSHTDSYLKQMLEQHPPEVLAG